MLRRQAAKRRGRTVRIAARKNFIAGTRRPTDPTRVCWPRGQGHPLLDSTRVLAALAGRLESQYRDTADGACDPACTLRVAQLTIEAYRAGVATRAL